MKESEKSLLNTEGEGSTIEANEDLTESKRAIDMLAQQSSIVAPQPRVEKALPPALPSEFQSQHPQQAKSLEEVSTASTKVGELVEREIGKLTRQSRMLQDEIQEEPEESKYDGDPAMQEGIPEEVPLFDRSEIMAWTLLGNGAFSEVYQVWGFRLEECHNETQREAREKLKATAMDDLNQSNYVIKHLRNDLLGPDKSRFVHAASDLVMEALFLSKLDHENIIKLRGTSRGIDTFGDCQHDGFFLILDRLDCTLSDRIAQWARHSSCRRKVYSRNLWDYAEKVDIGLQIARGLDYLHDRDIIYRDLKPDNLGIKNGVIKIFDFGLCREMPQECPLENKVFHMSGVGTRRYMAPEIFLTQHYNLKVDVYSFSIVMHSILSLVRPFEKYNAHLHTLLVCKEGVRPHLPHEWPTELQDMLRSAWAHRPSDRPRIKEVRQILERLAQRIQAEGVPPPATKREPLLGRMNDSASSFASCLQPLQNRASKMFRSIENNAMQGIKSTYPVARIFSKSAPPKKKEHAEHRKHLRSLYR